MFDDILGEKKTGNKKVVSPRIQKNIKIKKLLEKIREDVLFTKNELENGTMESFGKKCKQIWDNKEEFIKQSLDGYIEDINEIIGEEKDV